MKLELKRTARGTKATLGTLFVDDAWQCFTLEDLVRDLGPNGEGKIAGDTAIPAGTYKVIINMSPRLGKPMMRLLDVPFFDGILIHSGNDDEDTKGCILVGQVVDGPDHIHGGSLALPILFKKVQSAIAQGQIVMLEIHDA